jgi:hypothetical protein
VPGDLVQLPPELAPAGWNGGQLPYYGWKAIVTLSNIVSSGDGTAFSRIPNPIMGIVWYSLPPYNDLYYGNVTPSFPIPDGTTRTRANMNTQAYNQLADKIQNDPALKVWPFQWPPA